MAQLSIRKTAIVVGPLSAAALLAGCSSGSVSVEDLQEEGKITVGFAGEAPYSFEDNGQLTGGTVELHREIFGALGIDEVEGVQTEFGSLIPGLNAGRFDAVSAGMSILPDRCEQALFSEPEIVYTTALMVPEGNPQGLSDMQSLADAGARIVALTGAIEVDYAGELGIDVTPVGNPIDGMDAVIQGRADAFALTGVSLNHMKNTRPEAPVEVTESFVAVINGVPQVGAGGTVFRQDDAELRDAYNEQLAEIKADPERWLAIMEPFGFSINELPGPELTTEQLCAGVQELDE
ncbi:ectoine/hydroxyectoine ABC transporter substrate-binding protein EhuB [Hoyosella rhizosphaerae]|uniref:ABC transporter substrate-binding protein n=1 Tax=Hoyosella rhizosphaerae TaxID=1755582 RepID=A0A916U179_9ACTN|nr:ectoine/hydroxyectoine ABC transporter substrate-binding protein EhuB [Hoyosella rhizosphaerae]MBN4926759.1 ectoine/hydroxyectoine ABC transporter substrate-binding protein EhuB [Hoyosella rhizosphaerae]GGC56708.1 ABC transporter substrate-binding protein [Hoyosella rhizosphaerae]